MKVKIHTLFQYLLDTTQSDPEAFIGFSLAEPPKLGDFLNFLDPEMPLDWNLKSFRGLPELRQRVIDQANLQDCCKADDVLITAGAAEANYLAFMQLVEPGDEVVTETPGWPQIEVLAKARQAKVNLVKRDEANGWDFPMDQLENLVTDKTRLIFLTNPNNPTGSVMTDEEMTAIASIARTNDAYVHSDEVYRGSELGGKETRSFVEFYEKAIVCCGLSKSFAHPGLRIGWLVANEKLIEEIWAHKDYTSLCASVLSQEIAIKIMTKKTRGLVLSRSSEMLNNNLNLFQSWLDSHDGLFTFVPPQAGGMAFVGYKMSINSMELAHKLRTEQSVLIVPGDCYGMDGYLRFGIGSHSDYLSQGLELVSNGIKSIGC